jgi:hypothetical protein
VSLLRRCRPGGAVSPAAAASHWAPGRSLTTSCWQTQTHTHPIWCVACHISGWDGFAGWTGLLNCPPVHLNADLLIALQIEACDVVLGKIGYGTTSEVLATNTPLVFVRRSETPVLKTLHAATIICLLGDLGSSLNRATAAGPTSTKNPSCALCCICTVLQWRCAVVIFWPATGHRTSCGQQS